MFRLISTLSVLVLFVSLAPIATPTARAADSGSEIGWFGEIQGIALQEVNFADADVTPAFGLSLGHRFSDRVGLGLAVVSGTVESSFDFDFFGVFEVRSEIEIDVTPVLLELDFHLTPNRRADLVLTPIVGYALYGDLTNRVTTNDPAANTVATIDLPTDDGLIWGGQIGLDIDLGRTGRSYLSLGARFLQAELEVEVPDEGLSVGDLDLMLLHIGFGYRF